MERSGAALAGWRRAALLAAPLAFLALFFFYPLASIVGVGLGRSAEGPGAAVTETLRSATLHRALWFTTWQAALSTVLTLIVGLPGAYVLARFRFPGRSWVRALTGVAFVMPTLVVAAAFNALLGPRGWANLGLMRLFDLSSPPVQLMNTLWAILLAHVFYNTTIVIRLVGDFWARLDPRLGEAARMLGADRWAAARQVTLPLLAPAVGAAALLVFLFDFTSFGVVLVLGGPRFATLEVAIYQQAVSLFNLPVAAVLALVQLVCTFALTAVYAWLSRRQARPLTARTAEQTQRPPRSWAERLLVGGVVAGLFVLLVLPLVALAARAFVPVTPGDGSFSLAYFRLLASNPRQSMFYAPPTTALAVSLGYALATMVLGLALALPAALALARGGGSSSSRILDPLIMLPLGASAVTLGLGFLVALGRPPLALRDSPLLVPLAHTLVALPFLVRTLVPAVASLQPRLREAAAVLGASPWQALARVDLPLLMPALVVAAIFAGAISLGEFGATALIARPEYPTVPMAIYRLLGQPGALNYGQAMALATLLMVVTALAMLTVERVGARAGGWQL